VRARDIVIQISASLVRWLAEQHPDADIEATLLEELGHEDDGLVVSIGDEEFVVRVESSG
jgi:hypothetical protein